MSSPMCYTLSVLFCVLPPTNLRASDFLVSHGDRQLALPFPSNWPHLGPCTFNARCVQVRWTRWSTRSNYYRQTPQYAHVRYPDVKETTLATKYLGPKGHVEVVETLPTPERIPEEVGNLPLDTHVSVTPDAEPSSTPEPNPRLRLYRMRNLHLFVAPNEFAVLWLRLIFKGQGKCGVNDIASVALHYNSFCCT